MRVANELLSDTNHQVGSEVLQREKQAFPACNKLVQHLLALLRGKHRVGELRLSMEIPPLEVGTDVSDDTQAVGTENHKRGSLSSTKTFRKVRSLWLI